MSFYANFIYDGVISTQFGLMVSSTGASQNLNSADVTIHTEKIYRRAKPYLMGVEETPVLTIPITVTVENELSAEESSFISKWLFGQMNYKKLTILQPDMQYVYYNCIFTSPKIIKYGNIIRGYESTIVCDSPFAWTYPNLFTLSYDKNNIYIEDNVIFNSYSDSSDYFYPLIEFKMNSAGDFIEIINNTDDPSRIFRFQNLSPYEEVIANNDLQIIKSKTTGENRLPDFSYKWFRVVPGINDLIIKGGVRGIRIVSEFPKKI